MDMCFETKYPKLLFQFRIAKLSILHYWWSLSFSSGMCPRSSDLLFSNTSSSWLDRIPFVLLFGIATSVELFRERLPRKAARCLHGAQFNVEQVSSILERLFQTVISGSQTAFCVGAGLVSSLMERQSDHIQSVQAFISAFKVRTATFNSGILNS